MERNEQFIQKLHEFLQHAKGSRYDKAAVVYGLILEAEEPKEAFHYFLENADYIDSSKEQEVDACFTEQQLERYKREYAPLIVALLNKLVMSHCEKDEFYDGLWKNVMESEMLFGEEDVKKYALGRIWADTRIPYFYVKKGIHMSDSEFQNIVENKKELLKEVAFILGCNYEQRTETGSILLDVIERCADDKEKAVVIAKILDVVEKRTMISVLRP